MEDFIDKIELKLPLKPEYVRIARLAVSGIASRMGIDIETIEDIKVAISEVCNKLVENKGTSANDYVISFYVCPDRLVIAFSSDDPELGSVIKINMDDFGISLIEAFMDKTETCPDNKGILIMTKMLKGSV